MKLVTVVCLMSLAIITATLAYHYKALYIRHNVGKLDPLGLQSSPVEKTLRLTNSEALPRLVLLGDSRAKAWADTISDSPRFAVVDLGVNGQTTAEVLYRFKNQIPGLDADIIVIQVGINDLKQIGFNLGKKHQITAGCITNLTSIVHLASANANTVVVTTILPRSHLTLARRLIWNDEVDAAIVEANNTIRSLQGDNIHILDAAATLSHKGVIPAKYAKDTLHLNREGYKYLDLGRYLSNLN